ncbi:hypothetical protein CC1G_08676 [Coprinopsis cinerea okayama7|uniref:Uncharacterized protein n=1 Tax=Coprinopsis cinerea (strain Okayama-7 / 130 / ATCC MYA-4618 / FGSC 9003) TaxID=240176 RepID=A8NZF0_COPC7|nr:hypothetical protein CC1G_08676 [Coprinopsis cinerea okayama7\|eukprot:XP_001837663.2 hypothetical protein CC1G_08676 [Coprinopsis cinerea okayama7\
MPASLPINDAAIFPIGRQSTRALEPLSAQELINCTRLKNVSTSGLGLFNGRPPHIISPYAANQPRKPLPPPSAHRYHLKQYTPSTPPTIKIKSKKPTNAQWAMTSRGIPRSMEPRGEARARPNISMPGSTSSPTQESEPINDDDRPHFPEPQEVNVYKRLNNQPTYI